MSNKYPAYNEDDTFWDDHHRKQGLMTNREFFSSNAKGGFYEGMEYNEEAGEWVPDAETKRKERERENANKCHSCGYDRNNCWCE